MKKTISNKEKKKKSTKKSMKKKDLFNEKKMIFSINDFFRTNCYLFNEKKVFFLNVVFAF